MAHSVEDLPVYTVVEIKNDPPAYPHVVGLVNPPSYSSRPSRPSTTVIKDDPPCHSNPPSTTTRDSFWKTWQAMDSTDMQTLVHFTTTPSYIFFIVGWIIVTRARATRADPIVHDFVTVMAIYDTIYVFLSSLVVKELDDLSGTSEKVGRILFKMRLCTSILAFVVMFSFGMNLMFTRDCSQDQLGIMIARLVAGSLILPIEILNMCEA